MQVAGRHLYLVFLQDNLEVLQAGRWAQLRLLTNPETNLVYL